MSQPYVGQIILVGFNFAPSGFFPCDGRLLPISEYETLFNLIGTTYGGDGQNTFALPDLRGRLPIGVGSGPGLSSYVIGETLGVESVTLTVNQVPAHTHGIDVSGMTAAVACKTGPGNSQSPVGNVPAGEASGVTMPYSSRTPDVAMAAPLAAATTPATGLTGGTSPHDNLQPYAALQYCISLFGIYPSQT
jgi:microcystin-dependent protein